MRILFMHTGIRIGAQRPTPAPEAIVANKFYTLLL